MSADVGWPSNSGRGRRPPARPPPPRPAGRPPWRPGGDTRATEHPPRRAARPPPRAPRRGRRWRRESGRRRRPRRAASVATAGWVRLPARGRFAVAFLVRRPPFPFLPVVCRLPHRHRRRPSTRRLAALCRPPVFGTVRRAGRGGGSVTAAESVAVAPACGLCQLGGACSSSTSSLPPLLYLLFPPSLLRGNVPCSANSASCSSALLRPASRPSRGR